MQISPKLSMYLNIAMVLCGVIAGMGPSAFPSYVPPGISTDIVQTAGLISLVWGGVNAALHGMSSPIAGPIAGKVDPSKVASMMLLFAGLGLIGSSLAGCVQDSAGKIDWSASLAQADQRVRTYAPIIGKNLLVVADIVVQAECSPALAPTSQAVGNVLAIVAPDSGAAKKVTAVLQTNVAVTQQICPLVASIQASVGIVPKVAPAGTQVVAAVGG